MKKLFLIFCFLLFSSSLYAQDLIFINRINQTAAAGKSYIYGPVDFESGTYSTGEIDGQDSWDEETGSVDVFMIDTAYAHGGTQAFETNYHATSYGCDRVFSEQTSVFTVEMYILSNNTGGTTNGSPRFGISDGVMETTGNQAIQIRFSADDLQYYDGAAWQDITTGDACADETWYLIELEVDPDDDTWSVWVDGVSKGTDIAFRNALAAPDRIATLSRGDSGIATYIDDLEIYEGTRQ